MSWSGCWRRHAPCLIAAGAVVITTLLGCTVGLPQALPLDGRSTAEGAGNWWDQHYRHRRSLTVTAGTSPMPKGYTVSVEIDHAALLSAGKALASGQDVRILHGDPEGTMTELPRVADPANPWATTTTRLWFALASPIAASTADSNYSVYYGNPTAAVPPGSEREVFLAADFFGDGTLDSKLAPSTAGAATIKEASGELTIDVPDPVSNAGVVAARDALPADRQFQIVHKTKLVSGAGAYGPEVKLIGIAESASPVGVAAQAVEIPRRRITLLQQNNGEVWLFYISKVGKEIYWNDSSWIVRGSEPATWRQLALDGYLLCSLTSNGASWSVEVRNGKGEVLTTTQRVPWSDLSTNEPLWVYWGEVYTDFYSARQVSDWFYLRRYIEPGPNVVLGAEVTL